MNNRRSRLPQLDGGLFLTDGGIETTLIYQEGFDLPCSRRFTCCAGGAGARGAAPLLHAPRVDRARARRRVRLGKRHLAGQRRLGRPRSATRPASSRRPIVPRSISSTICGSELRPSDRRVVISGCVGPRGDGYRPEAVMTPAAARAYHARVRVFAAAGADLATAITMTNSGEAIGIVRAAQAEGLPVVISFTVETDGQLPSGESLPEAIAAVDGETGGAAECS